MISRVPTPVMVAVWPALNVPVMPATVNEATVTVPSTLEVPLSRVPLTAVSSGVVVDSFSSVKASTTGVMVMFSADSSVLVLPSDNW